MCPTEEAELIKFERLPCGHYIHTECLLETLSSTHLGFATEQNGGNKGSVAVVDAHCPAPGCVEPIPWVDLLGMCVRVCVCVR